MVIFCFIIDLLLSQILDKRQAVYTLKQIKRNPQKRSVSKGFVVQSLQLFPDCSRLNVLLRLGTGGYPLEDSSFAVQYQSFLHRAFGIWLYSSFVR